MIDSSLPLTDIHRHLDGNIRAQTILDLGREFNIALPASTLDTLRPHVQVTSLEPDLVSFLAKLDWGVKVLASLEACRRVAYENVEDAARNGLHYVELRFSPRYMAMTHQLPVDGVVEAVIAGVREGSRDFQVDARLIGILSRTFGEAACQEELAALLAHREGITALDLAGDELGFPGALFLNHFNQARDAGWHITVHAGEAAGPESIWQAIRELGAERIGHGVKAVEDPALMDYLAEHQIGIESCLTSNVQTSTVASLALVTEGRLPGSPASVRQASQAKASASISSPLIPASSVVETSVPGSSAARRAINKGLRAPPPHTNKRSQPPLNNTCSLMVTAVNSASVACTSCPRSPE